MRYRITIDLDIQAATRATITTQRIDIDHGCVPAPEVYSCTQPSAGQALRLAFSVGLSRLASVLSPAAASRQAPTHGVCGAHRARRY